MLLESKLETHISVTPTVHQDTTKILHICSTFGTPQLNRMTVTSHLNLLTQYRTHLSFRKQIIYYNARIK